MTDAQRLLLGAGLGIAAAVVGWHLPAIISRVWGLSMSVLTTLGLVAFMLWLLPFGIAVNKHSTQSTRFLIWNLLIGWFPPAWLLMIILAAKLSDESDTV